MPDTFIAITATDGYISRIFWTNSGIHSDFPRWGSIHLIPRRSLAIHSAAGLARFL